MERGAQKGYYSTCTGENGCFVSCTAHITEHLPPPFDVPAPLTESATLAASVNASLTPRFRFAEHSVQAIDVSLQPSIAIHGSTTETERT